MSVLLHRLSDETLLFPKQLYGYVSEACCAVLLRRIVAYDEEVLVRAHGEISLAKQATVDGKQKPLA